MESAKRRNKLRVSRETQRLPEHKTVSSRFSLLITETAESHSLVVLDVKKRFEIIIQFEINACLNEKDLCVVLKKGKKHEIANPLKSL